MSSVEEGNSDHLSWWCEGFDEKLAREQARMRRELPEKRVQIALDQILELEEKELRGFATKRTRGRRE